MIDWTDSGAPLAYAPPDDHPRPPVPPRSSWRARAADGAALVAYRWGSALGDPFVLELRRYGAPACVSATRDLLGVPREETTLEPAELPTLVELQAAVDHCIPHGTVLLLAVQSNGAEATYPAVATFRALRMVQANIQLLPVGGVSQ